MRITDIPEIKNLSTSEKILFVEDLWDMISLDEDSIPVPQSHKDELDKRFKRYQSDPGVLLSLSDLQGRIEKRK
jgi:putative addiction module component (TIGR02574 family)